MFQKLIEATLGQLNTKQKSITRLFPDFFSNSVKVKGVIEKGGVRLSSIDRDKWTFKVHSGTEEGLWYEVVIRWKDVEKDVQKLVSDRRNWTKDKKRADLRKIAAKLFKDGNVELSCECPAQQYWGPAYQLTQRHAKYGDQEDRSPGIRNPKEYGQYCKHVQVLMRTLPFYKTTIANWLGKEFKDLIQRTEGEAVRTTQRYRTAGRALGQRLARESVQETVATLPELQKRMYKAFKVSDKLIPNVFEDDYKFWILNDGSVIPIDTTHGQAAYNVLSDLISSESEDIMLQDDAAHAAHNEFLWSGAIRGYLIPGDSPELGVEHSGEVTDAQIKSLQRLFVKYGVRSFAVGAKRYQNISSDRIVYTIRETIQEE